MKVISDVYKDIEDSNITVLNHNFKNDRSAVIIQDKNKEHYIFLDNNKIMNTRDEKCALAEEYAHYKTGAFYNIYSEFELIDKLEQRAKKYQTKYLISKHELVNAIKQGHIYYYELANLFDVPEETIKTAIELYNIEYEIISIERKYK